LPYDGFQYFPHFPLTLLRSLPNALCLRHRKVGAGGSCKGPACRDHICSSTSEVPTSPQICFREFIRYPHSRSSAILSCCLLWKAIADSQRLCRSSRGRFGRPGFHLGAPKEERKPTQGFEGSQPIEGRSCPRVHWKGDEAPGNCCAADPLRRDDAFAIRQLHQGCARPRFFLL